MSHTERFARLLKWYPRKWRQQHGNVLLSTILDEAEGTGRTAPSAGDHATAAIYGLGSRLGSRFALWCAVLALLASLFVGISFAWATDLLASAWLVPALISGVCPLLVTLGLIALLRGQGIISEPRALALVPLTIVTVMLMALGQIAWSVGFDEADAGQPMSPFAGTWLWFSLSALVIGTTTLALFFDGLLRNTRLHRAIAVPLSILLGLAAATTIAVLLLMPFTSSLIAIALGIAALASSRTQHHSGILSPAPSPAPMPLTKRTRDQVRALMLISAGVSSVGIIYALSGSLWFANGPDATAAMNQGISISLFAALPLLIAVGMIVAPRSQVRPVHTWGPLLLFALSLCTMGSANQLAPEADISDPVYFATSMFGAAALSWLIATRLPGQLALRISITALIGLVSAASLGIVVALLYLAFPMPLIALALTIWTPGVPRRKDQRLPQEPIALPTVL